MLNCSNNYELFQNNSSLNSVLWTKAIHLIINDNAMDCLFLWNRFYNYCDCYYCEIIFYILTTILIRNCSVTMKNRFTIIRHVYVSKKRFSHVCSLQICVLIWLTCVQGQVPPANSRLSYTLNSVSCVSIFWVPV